jgi:hypothetical protein
MISFLSFVEKRYHFVQGLGDLSETVSVRTCVDTTTVSARWLVLLASLQKPSQGTPRSEEFCLLTVILLVLS